MSLPKFSGLPPDAIKFLKQLKRNNNRDWFAANKDRYRDNIVQPMSAFIEAMAPRLAQTANCFVADPRTNGGSMFRIYRDTRFGNDKTPYKLNIGCHFRHNAGKDAHAPGFYVHIEAEQTFFGGGIWRPPTPVLNRIRDTIVDNPKEWSRIKQAKPFTRLFDGIIGDQLQRAPRGYDPGHPHLEDLRRKSLYAVRTVETQRVTTADFIKDVDTAIKSLSSFMKFITYALDLPYHIE